MPKADLIFDVGCNTGEDADFYLRKGFRVVAVEANPTVCAGLRARFAEPIGDGRLVLIDKAIADQPGRVTFFDNLDDSSQGTIVPSYAYDGSKAIEVEAIAFASLLDEFGVPHYLKIDIQGADNFCLRGLIGRAEKPKFISIERVNSFAAQREQFGLLRSLGYGRFQIIDQTTLEDQIPPQPSREGVYVSARFTSRSTGLFGNDLPETKWTGYHRAMARNLEILARSGAMRRIPILNRFAMRGKWFDIHAALA